MEINTLAADKLKENSVAPKKTTQEHTYPEVFNIFKKKAFSKSYFIQRFLIFN